MNFDIRVLNKTHPTGWDWSLYLLTFVPVTLLLIISAMQSYVPVSLLTKDMLTAAELAKDDCCHVYFGLISNVGIILWCAGAVVCLFVALFLFIHRGKQSDIFFLSAAGLFTAWLMLDDLFLVHEDVLPVLGIPQPVTYGVYACFAAFYFLMSWKRILSHRPLLLLLALSLLGTSVLTDVFLESESDFHVLTEDGSKLLGISAWASFHIEAAYKVLSEYVRSL